MHPSISGVLSLLIAAVSFMPGLAAAAETKHVPGGIIFIGDSITQGGKYLADTMCASYRYSLFKNYVDNGVPFHPMGVVREHAWSANIPTPDYRGQAFPNVSEAAASGRSYQFSGHAPHAENGAEYQPNPTSVYPVANRGPLRVKFGMPDPYTGKEATYYNGATETEYTGDTYSQLYGETKAQSATVLIGINDLYDCNPNASGGRYAHAPESILENVHSIISTLQAYNKTISILVMEVLPVGKNNPARHQGIDEYNALLRQTAPAWSTATSRVTCADVSPGFCAENGEMIDTAQGAHPNAQGELIIAGNLARALGIGQRNLGYERKSASQLTSRAEGCGLRHELPPVTTPRIGTYEVSIHPGAGKQGEGTCCLEMIVGDGVSGAGKLTVEKGNIYWGDVTGTMLYASHGTLSNTLRIVVDKDSSGAASLYHVWLGDQLIGENLRINTPGAHLNHLLIDRAPSAGNTDGLITGIAFELGTPYAPPKQRTRS